MPPTRLGHTYGTPRHRTLAKKQNKRNPCPNFSYQAAALLSVSKPSNTTTYTLKLDQSHLAPQIAVANGATIIDQQVCIARWGHNEESSSFWEQHSWRLDDDNETMAHGDHFTTTPREAINITQEVVKTMLAKGYVLGKDALQKAKALDESYQVSASAASRVADMSKKIGLTDKINAGFDAVRSVDERYHVMEMTKTAVSATGRTAAAVGSSIVNSSYFSAGALWVSDALSRAAKAAADLSERGARN